MGCLYKLTSPSGKAYLGISKFGLEKRWAKHVEHALGKRSNGYLYTALRKYGAEAFVREVIAESDDWSELCAMEIVAIVVHGTLWPNGYNLTTGGEGVAGRVLTDIARENVIRAQKRRFENADELARLAKCGAIGNVVRSQKCAAERQVKKERQAIYIASAEFKAMRSESIKAALRRPEVAAKVLACAKERAASPEWKRKMSETKKGVSTGPCTEQRRRLISEARKREWADPVMREKRLEALARAHATTAARRGQG